MTNKARNRKKSNFLEESSIPSGATFDYVSNGTNYKISKEDLLTALGVTGTLEQLGDPAQTPILKQVSTVNYIRNLEDGSGVKASVSINDGALLDHNFTVDKTGVAVMKDETADSPTIRSILAGSGISVAASNGAIQIALSATPVTTKTVIVNELGDFPAPVANVITLDDDTLYFLTNDISSGINRFVLGDNTIVDGSDSLLITLEYTGTGTMFTSSSKTNRIKNLGINCPNGMIFDISSVGSDSFFFEECTIIECDSIGTIDTMLFFSMNICDFRSIVTDGISFLNNTSILSISRCSAVQTAGTFIDLASATFSGITIDAIFANMSAGTTFLDGLVNSGNINTGGLGLVSDTRIVSAGTVLNNITVFDNLWQFDLNDSIPNSRDTALIRNTGVAVVIAALNTPVKIDGNWVEQDISHFETDTSGTITYKGTGAYINLTATVTAESATATKAFTFYFTLNGSPISASGILRNLTAGSPGNLSMVWSLSLETDDEIEIWVENNTDSTNCTINNIVARAS